MPKGNNPIKRWAVLSGIAIQMGVIIYLFVQLGKWMDKRFMEGGKTFLIIGTLTGVAISMFLVVKQTKDLNS